MLRLLLATSVAAVAAGCQTPGAGGDRVRDSEALAERAVANAEYVDAAAIYGRLAATAEGERARQLAVASALAWLDAGDAARAREAVADYDPRPDSAAEDAPWLDETDWLLLVAGLVALDDGADRLSRPGVPLDVVGQRALTAGQRVRYQRWPRCFSVC